MSARRARFCAVVLVALALRPSTGFAGPQPPPSGPLLDDQSLNSILTEDDKGKQTDHHETEPWPRYPQQDVARPDKRFANPQLGKTPFEAAHHEAHELLDKYKEQSQTGLTAGQLKQGISDIVFGVRKVVDTGLRFIDAEGQPSGPDRDRQLNEAKRQMGEATRSLNAIPIDGGPVSAQLMDGRYDDPQFGKNGMMAIAQGVSPESVSTVLAQNPANPGLQVAAGNLALGENKPEKAKAHFDNALSLDPGNAQALTGRAAANVDLGNMRQAAQDARDALRINPDEPAAKAILGLAHDAVGEGVQIDKRSPFGQQAGADGSAASRGPFGESALRYLPPSNGAGLQSSAYTREALRALNLGDPDAALRNSARAIALDPKNADAYGLRAFAHAAAGHYDEALKDAVAALALDPSNTMAHNARAKALNKMGMYHEALAAADDAIRANPHNAYAYYMKAMALNGLGNRKEMLAALGQAAALDPRYQDAYDLAKQAPDEKDLGFLFPEDQLAAARSALGAQPRGPKRYFWGLTLPSIVGAALVLFGMLHFAFSWAVPRLRGSYAAAMRTGPSLSGNTVVASLPTPPPLSTGRHPPAGTVLRGQYRRLGQIGSSVHGAVYEGVDQALERRVVIRKLRADMRAADRERLLAPARAAASLANAGIAAVYSVFEEGEALYLVSEFAPGRSLRDWLAARGPLSWEEALPLFKQVAAALDYAHAKGIPTARSRPPTSLISSEGRAKLVDFGLSRGPTDKAGDLAAFAACLREAIAGLPPAQLDAVDAALARARAQIGSAAQVLEVVEAGLASAA